VQIEELRREKPIEVNEGLYVVSCGLDTQVRVYPACIIDEVRYSTVDRGKSLCTQNSGFMDAITHEGKIMEFYGVLRDVVKFMYHSSIQSHRIEVLLHGD